jgi:hypothetical protein
LTGTDIMIISLIILINIVLYSMRASAKTRYAMEAMVDMAMQLGGGLDTGHREPI